MALPTRHSLAEVQPSPRPLDALIVIGPAVRSFLHRPSSAVLPVPTRRYRGRRSAPHRRAPVVSRSKSFLARLPRTSFPGSRSTSRRPCATSSGLWSRLGRHCQTGPPGSHPLPATTREAKREHLRRGRRRPLVSRRTCQGRCGRDVVLSVPPGSRRASTPAARRSNRRGLSRS